MLPSINISTDLDKLTRWARALAADQVPFATALALTRTAADAATELAREMPQLLDKPTPFTLKAWSIKRADKRTLTATVFAKDAQAKYLQWAVYGGDRKPTKVALKLPSAIKVNEFGNIPRAELKRLIELAKEGKRLTRARAKRTGVSAQVDLFYGDPGNGMPVGVYKRVPNGQHHRLIPLVVFPRQSAHYRQRFPMRAIVDRVVRARFADHYAAAWAQAMRSAR